MKRKERKRATWGERQAHVWKRLRKKLFRQQPCIVCGTREELELHHRIPQHAGGPTNATNAVVLCHACHLAIHQGRLDVPQVANPIYLELLADALA